MELISKYSPENVPYYESYLGPSFPHKIYLHGDGQSGDGTTNTLSKIQQVAFFKKFYQQHKDKFNIFMPQYKSTSHGWGELGNRFVDFVLAKYPYDGRYYLSGHSSGGRGVMYTTNYMDYFKKNLPTACAVIAGESDYKGTITLIGKVPIKLFVGDPDNTKTDASGKTVYQKMVSTKTWLYGEKYEGPMWKVYPGVGHGSDNNAYDASEGLAEWFLSQGKPVEPPINPVTKIPLKNAYFILPDKKLEVELENGEVLRFTPD